MSLTNLPMLCYFVHWDEVTGTHILGFIGLSILFIACVATWHQIKNDKSVDCSPY